MRVLAPIRDKVFVIPPEGSFLCTLRHSCLVLQRQAESPHVGVAMQDHGLVFAHVVALHSNELHVAVTASH